MGNETVMQDRMEVTPSTGVPGELDKFTSIVNILRGSEEFILNREGIIISSNLEAVTITGYEEWEVIGKHFSMFYTDEDQLLGRHREDLDLTFRQGRLHTLAWRLKKRKAVFWAKIKFSVMLDEDGIAKGIRMVLRDATHEAMSNYRVKRLRSEYLNVFNNPFIGIFKFRLDDCRVSLINEKAQEIFGLEKTDQLFFQDLFAVPSEFETFLELILANKKVTGFDFMIAASSGERWGSISCSYFGDGHFVEGVVLDISESKKQVLELQRLNFELDQFIYHASHDLRSPLTTLLGLVNLIELEPAKNTLIYTPMLKERINHLDTLLRDLVHITLNGKSEMQTERIDFESELPLVVGDFRQQYEQVEIRLSRDQCCDFYTDSIRFRTILRNLVSNALKYHNVHAAPPYLKIHIRCTAERALFTFEDNGIGIDEVHIPKIFNMFYRASSKPQGTGLGLYIVRLMVDKLKGKIHVSSVRGKGTVFHLELPNGFGPNLQAEKIA